MCNALTVGEGAFVSWTYVLKIRAVEDPPGSEDTVNTSRPSFLLENLQPETLYEISLSASGPGGSQTTQNKFIFSTKSTGTLVSYTMI